MPRRTAQQSTDRWLRRMQASGQDYIEGIQSVTVAPGQAAAANHAGYTNGVAANVQKWRNNVAAVTREEWVQAAVTKGAPRLASGAAAAVPKVMAAQERVGQMVDRAKAAIANMDRSTPEARIARSQAFLTHMRTQAQNQNGRR